MVCWIVWSKCQSGILALKTRSAAEWLYSKLAAFHVIYYVRVLFLVVECMAFRRGKRPTKCSTSFFVVEAVGSRNLSFTLEGLS